MDWYSIANKSLNTKIQGEITKHVIPDFSPVNQIITATHRCVKHLKELEDDSLSTFKWSLWNLKQSVTHAVVEFNSDQIFLDEQLSKVLVQAKHYPSLTQDIARIEQSINYLIETPQNPKQQIFNGLIDNCHSIGEKFGVIFPPANRNLIGWSGELMSLLLIKSNHCKVIDSRKSLLTNNFNNVILASGGWYLSYMHELLHAGSCANLNLVVYDKESIKHLNRKTLPPGTVNLFAGDKDKIKITESATEIDEVSSWLDDEYWNLFEPNDVGGVAYDTDHQYMVKAKLIILTNGRYLFLKDGQKVIEVSDIATKNKAIYDIGKKFPRKLVNELDDGDYLLLRTDGSGDYLHEVADNLMKKDKLFDLRLDALSWKPYLKSALEKHGSFEIQKRLALKGHKLSSNNYVWIWTTDEVISPESDLRFLALIEVLGNLGELQETDVIKYSSMKWELMQKLKKYHAKAGGLIRQMLLNKLKQTIDSNVEIHDGFELKLSGVDSGIMRVCRVTGVSPKSNLVPYSELNIIKKGIT